VVDFEQHRFIGLHDQGAVGHPIHYPEGADMPPFRYCSADTTDVTRWMANSRTRPDAGS
jgi:hypothetical protein